MIRSVKNTFNEHFVLIIALCLGLAVYYRFLFYGHISWDDPEMVFRNQAVTGFKLKSLLTGHFVGNYIPLTMLVHAFVWLLFEDSDAAHHLVNLLLHLVNGILVYKIVIRFLKNKDGAGLTALVFLLHPLQVESVGWISELKNCLYATGSFLSIYMYLEFLATGKQKDYLLTLLFFLAACLAKSSAVILPFILLAIDMFVRNEFRIRFLVNKIPFFLLSVIFGLVNLKTQAADQFINYSHAFPFHERLANAGYAIMLYFTKFIAPIDQSVLYPFPPKSMALTVCGFACLLVTAACLWFLARKKKFDLLAVLLMILCSFVLVLQFVPFGECLVADRYMYTAIVFMSLFFVLILQQLKLNLKYLSYIFLLVLSLAAFKRVSVWENSVKLYSDVVSKYPDSFVALNSLGVEYMMRNDDGKALACLNRAAVVAPRNYKAFYNRGLLFLKMNRPEDAIRSFNESLALHDYNKSYVGRASAYYMLKDISKAVNDAEHVLKKDASQPKAWFVIGNCYNEMNKLDEAVNAYNKSIETGGDDPDFYFKRAIAYGKKQDFKKCLEDLNSCLEINPGYIEAYYWRGVAKVNLGTNPCEDLKIAARNNLEPAVNAYAKYCR